MLFSGDSQRIAVLVGGSGLVGSRLLELFLDDIAYRQVVVLNRRPLGIQHPKLREVITDFTDEDLLLNAMKGAEVLFCCIGTTIRIAGSKEAFRQVDYEIPVRLARLAEKAEIHRFLVVSSVGANPNSGNFYLRTKGEMERDVAAFRFLKLAIVRPSLLLGPRKDFRLGERMAQIFTVLCMPLMFGPFRKYKPVHRDVVAKALINLSLSVNNQRIYESEDLYWLGK